MLTVVVAGLAVFAGVDGLRFEAVGPNLAENPGFEVAADNGMAAGWGGPREVFRREAEAGRGGTAALRYDNADAARYVLSGRAVALEPGRRYEIAAWVKAQGVAGKDTGATICAEWYDGSGGYLGGCYPRGIKGDADWHYIQAVTGRVPPEAARCSITMYVRQGMTGTAWWDDVSVRLVRENPMSTLLLEPNYRDEITDAGPASIRIRAELNLADYEQEVDDVGLQWRLFPAQGNTATAHGALDTLDPAGTDLAIPARDLAPGRYRIQVSLVDKASGDVLSQSETEVARVAGTPQRTAFIDRHNRLILNGEPFFPLGMYWSGITDEELAVYAESAFNCLMPYGPPSVEQMDAAHRRGLKVIYSVKDCYFGTRYCPPAIKREEDERPYIERQVEAVRDHPALLAWYINDELPLDMLSRLATHRRWLEELDPGHPTWVVLYQVDDVRAYLPSYHVIGTDPYPIPHRPAAMAGEWTRKTAEAVGGHRPVWQVPQAFNWANYKSAEEDKKKQRPPTLDELRSMAWQCIAEGANGLVFYSWFDMRRDPDYPFAERWPEMKAVAAEIDALIPVLLSVEAPPEIAVSDTPGLSTLVKRHRGMAYLFAVNGTPEALSADVTFAEPPDSIEQVGSGERITPVPSHRLGLRFAPFQVRILRLAGV
ncbi:MAG: hypothetical protein JXR94_10230 [Candidatus Hydrogenedentes bacterium]|nr:hypothetical protein [Candidatus Hydrogenedentota bacterium]